MRLRSRQVANPTWAIAYFQKKICARSCRPNPRESATKNLPRQKILKQKKIWNGEDIRVLYEGMGKLVIGGGGAGGIAFEDFVCLPADFVSEP